MIININVEGFPGSQVVKHPPANTGGPGLIPGPGRSHRHRANPVPQLLELFSATGEAIAMRSPCSLQREKAHVQQQRCSTAKNKINFKKSM